MGLLDGRVILITGAGNGIGRCHALSAAAEGALIVVNDLGGSRHGEGNDDAAAAKVVAEIKANGGDAIANFDSVTDATGTDRMVAAAMAKWGRLDAIVNNAGILRDVTFKKMEDAQWNAVLDVHLNGTKNVCKSALAALTETAAKHGHAAIINTTSYSGMIGNFGQSNYAAAKAGIYGLTRVLSMELRKAGVSANAIAPIAKTRMTDDIDMVDDDWTAAQISPIVLFLASELSKGVTGKVFGVQGQRLHVYEVQTNDGVDKEGSGLWTPTEIAERLNDIMAFDEPAPASAGADQITAAFSHFPAGFKATAAPGWTANIQWSVKGGANQTIIIENDAVTVKPGLEGTPSCTVKIPADVLIALLTGEMDAQKVFMTGKATADNMGDLMKMAMAFDFGAVAKSLAAAGDSEDLVTKVFSHFPAGFKPDAAPAWKGIMHWVIKGGTPQTLTINDGVCSTQEGLNGTPTSTIKIPEDVLLAMFKGEIDPQKVFMSGKATADDFGDLMKMGMAFDFKKIAKAAGLIEATNEKAAEPENSGPKTWPIGKRYDGGHFLVSPEHIAQYASATNDNSSAYEGAGGIAPHMLHTRMFKDCMFQIATDPELDINLLRLVHGEHDAIFHHPIKAWDLIQVRGELISVTEKSSGKLVTSKIYGFVNGIIAVEATTSYFIRGDKKKAAPGEAKKAAPKPPPPEAPSPDFEIQFRVDDDQSYRYAKASLDDNPIHVDPKTAKAAGLPSVILHGLCTMAMSGKSVIDTLADGDPRRLKRLGVRFASPVFNAEDLTTQGWKTDKGSKFIVLNKRGKAVITNGVVELA
jgi:NAD(P)-dependent dehydrogenase (short-subunit alcohol dehydrogenase family)/acyl dehydratase/putative sterol carrier protein